MISEARKHPIDFTALILGFIFLAYTFFLYQHEPKLQIIIIWAAAAYYFIWGVVHHLLRDDFHPKVAVEYFFMALFAGWVGTFVLRML